MLAVLPFLLFSVLVAAIAASRRRRVPAAQAVTTAPHIVAHKVLGLTRIGQIGTAALPEPVRASMRIAPSDAATTAVELFAADGTELATIPAHRVVMARGWSRGRLLLSYGEMRREYGTSWPLGPNLAGWEVHLVDASGAVYRCYGAPHTDQSADLERLHTRLQALVLAEAS
jgi:hypothetical protein